MYFSDNPPIIHVSLDGYRADYYKRMLNPNLQFVMDTGVRAEYMRSQYPTLTFPNHYTIMTVSSLAWPDPLPLRVLSLARSTGTYTTSDNTLRGRGSGHARLDCKWYCNTSAVKHLQSNTLIIHNASII